MIIIVNFNTAIATTRQKICKNIDLKDIVNQQDLITFLECTTPE